MSVDYGREKKTVTLEFILTHDISHRRQENLYSHMLPELAGSTPEPALGENSIKAQHFQQTKNEHFKNA
jgi:hypothetical protein